MNKKFLLFLYIFVGFSGGAILTNQLLTSSPNLVYISLIFGGILGGLIGYFVANRR